MITILAHKPRGLVIQAANGDVVAHDLQVLMACFINSPKKMACFKEKYLGPINKRELQQYLNFNLSFFPSFYNTPSDSKYKT